MRALVSAAAVLVALLLLLVPGSGTVNVGGPPVEQPAAAVAPAAAVESAAPARPCPTCANEGSCTDIVVGKRASTDGSVMTSHTADCWYDSRLQI
ncbi:MAG TPA: C69 family dipeptidase, partial [Gemmatimonadales bacterium]|nr:C69 family dipeptidase [Gemmatimonadales bacterium]